jgi:hypothetical protein
MKASQAAEMSCATCGLRRKADSRPRSIIARFWRWHTTWCPGWKAYQAALQAEQSRS